MKIIYLTQDPEPTDIGDVAFNIKANTRWKKVNGIWVYSPISVLRGRTIYQDYIMWKHYITLLREQKVAALSSVQAVVTYIVEALSIASIPIIL